MDVYVSRYIEGLDWLWAGSHRLAVSERFCAAMQRAAAPASPSPMAPGRRV